MSNLRISLETVTRRYPPSRYHLDDYKRWFPTTGKAFIQCLKRLENGPSPDGRDGEFVLVIGPWVSTPVPWYGIMLGLGLAQRGRKVTLLWDDTGFPEKHLDEQNAVIGKVLSYAGTLLPVERLSAQVPAGPHDAAVVERLTELNVVWRLRGAAPLARQQRIVDGIRASLAETHGRVRGFLDRSDPDCVVVPGGVYGASGLFLHEAGLRNCRVATFDTDRRVAQICASGIAAQNADIPGAFNAVWGSDGEARSRAIGMARAELETRVANRDSYGFQSLPSSGAGSDADGAVLIPLNVEWDTAALGRHIHFADTIDWITSTVDAVLARDAGPVIVRQHPSERRKLQRSNLDISAVLKERFGDDPRCCFVGAADSVNSYDLLRSCRLVLPFVSTIALEAAALGKPVLISGSCYYAGLGFVWTARSRDEYFSLLHRGLDGGLPLLPEQTDRAWVAYYLAAVQNRIPTDFTPHPDDFWSWCRRSPDAIFAEPEVSDILEAIDSGTPVSLLRHHRVASTTGVA